MSRLQFLAELMDFESDQSQQGVMVFLSFVWDLLGNKAKKLFPHGVDLNGEQGKQLRKERRDYVFEYLGARSSIRIYKYDGSSCLAEISPETWGKADLLPVAIAMSKRLRAIQDAGGGGILPFTSANNGWEYLLGYLQERCINQLMHKLREDLIPENRFPLGVLKDSTTLRISIVRSLHR